MSCNIYLPYIIYKNVLIYLQKYRHATVETKIYDETDFKKLIQFNGYFQIEAKNDKKIYVLIFTEMSKQITKSDLFRRLIKTIPEVRTINEQTKNTEIILISYNDVGTYIRKVIETLKESGINLKPYTYDIFKNEKPIHVLVDKHIILSDAETEAILNSTHTKKNQWPFLLANSDPVAIWIGAKPGDFIKIVSKNVVSGESINYRHAV